MMLCCHLMQWYDFNQPWCSITSSTPADFHVCQGQTFRSFTLYCSSTWEFLSAWHRLQHILDSHTNRDMKKNILNLKVCVVAVVVPSQLACGSYLWKLESTALFIFYLGFSFVRSFCQWHIVWNQWRCWKQQVLWLWLSQVKTESSLQTVYQLSL